MIPKSLKSLKPLLFPAVVAGLLAACSTPYVPRIVTEYRIDVQQGNVLNQEMVAQLKPGQTKDQVRFILGTPLITDMFHQQRWDYLYRFENGRTGEVQTRRLSLFFSQDGRLERAAGDVDVASVAELTGPVARAQVLDLGALSEDGQAAPLPPVEEKGFFKQMLEKIGF